MISADIGVIHPALQDASHRKDVILAAFAHELRNPLAPLRSGLQTIRLAKQSEDVDRTRGMMDRQLTHLLRLVDDLLDVGRVSTGKLELQCKPVTVREIVDAAIETFGPKLAQPGRSFASSIPREPAYVHGDITRLAQVVSNLLYKAAKYAGPAVIVRVGATYGDDHVELWVSDNGIGIAESSLESIFEMFNQADRDAGRLSDGLGIGLALSRSLVELHGGRITARSDGPGKGSKFVVRLPHLKSPIGST